jgi:hypothetical protein
LHFGVDHLEAEQVVAPILAGAVCVLHSHSQSIFLASQLAGDSELNFQQIVLAKVAKGEVFNAGVCAEDVDGKAITNQDTRSEMIIISPGRNEVV